MTLAKWLTLVGGISLFVGLVGALVSNRYAAMKKLLVAKNPVKQGGLTESPKARAEWWFRAGLGLTALGVILQTLGALFPQMGRSEMKTALNVIGLFFGVVAAVCMYYASIETPWGVQSWSGQTEAEQRFRRRRTWWARIGFILLGLAFVCQLVATLIHW